MPRSARSAAPRSSTASTKRPGSKRATSRQRSIYTIPQSPDGSETESNDYPANSDSRANTVVSSPTHERDDNDLLIKGHDGKADPARTLTQKTSKADRLVTQAALETRIPKNSMDALEAVSTLLDTARTSQIEVEHAKATNTDLQRQIVKLQADLKNEKDKVAELKRRNEKDVQSSRQRDRDSEKTLQGVIDALKNYGPAASGIMPLLDVLAGAANIRYDGHAERLWALLKPEKDDGCGSKRDHNLA